MKLSVLIVNRTVAEKAVVSEQARTEDIVAVAQETGIPLRMLNDMVASWENADSHPVVAIERGMRWDPSLVYRVEVIPTREPDHEPYDVEHS
jgi:hypothetical protein